MKQVGLPLLVLLLVLSCKQGPKTSETNILQPEAKSPTEMEVGATTQTPKEMGMKFAQETQKVLGKNLMGTIQNKGVEEAVVFCNERAYPLTDSMSMNFNARIKRVSDKPRNPDNAANASELAYIETFKKDVAAGVTLEPILKEVNGKVHFYYPIVTNSMCLNCHGIPGKSIQADVVQHLSRLYPDDKATGYDVNEVRGIWSIVFDAPNDSN